MYSNLPLPIGLLVTMLGALLTAYGALACKAVCKATMGINANLGWGIVLLVFGIGILTLTLNGERK